MLLIARARALFTDGGVYRFTPEEARSRGRQYFSRDYRAEGKLLGKWSMNERLPRVIRKIFTLENCVCETCTTGNKGNCVGGRIFILRSYCEVYRKFTRVLIVEIIFLQDGIDRRGDWNGKLKKLRGGRIFILRSVIRSLCKFGKINCWNYF